MRKLYLIDGNSYFYRAYFAITHLSNSKGLPTNAVYGFTNMLLKIIREDKPDYILVAFDSKAPTFRHKKFEEYKINRPEMPADLVIQIPYIKEIISALNILSVAAEGWEADDILGTLSRNALEKGFDEIILVTGDKDAMQLIGEKVKVLSVSKGEKTYYDAAKVQEKFGVTPGRIVDLLALMGDSSDNIPGVPGVGDKTARMLISEFGDIDEIYEKLASITSNKLRETLIKYKEQAYLSRTLSKISEDVPVDFDIVESRIREPDWERLRKLLMELEFFTLLKTLPEAKGIEIPEECVIINSIEGIDKIFTMISGKKVFSFEIPWTATPPFYKPNGICFYIPDSDYYFISEDFISRERIFFQKFIEVLNNREITKISHDIKPLLQWLLISNTEEIPSDIFDTALASYLLNPSRLNYGLEEIAMEYLSLSLPSIRKFSEENGMGLTDSISEISGACAVRAKGIYRLWEKLKGFIIENCMKDLFSKIELPLIPALASMETKGVRVDPQRLADMSMSLQKDILALQKEIFELAGESFNINSPKQLADVLFVKLKLPVIKKTKTGYSTDVDVLQELALGHPLPAKILDFRQLTKLKSTYVDAMPALINSSTGRIHTSYNQMVTATGRLSSSNPNLQNIPIRSALSKKLRQAFIPDEGYIFLSGDYSQIELRIMAHLSDEVRLIDAFLGGEDIHSTTACDVFHIKKEEVIPEMRRLAKVVNFGIMYGISAYGLSRDLGISHEEAQVYIDSYFARYPRVKEFIEKTISEAKEKGFVSTLFGRRRYVPEINSPNANIRQFSERMAINAPMQGTAADIIKIAMVRLFDRIKLQKLKSSMIMQIHDELIFETHEEEKEIMRKLIVEIMEGVIELKVPLKVDLKEGKDLAEVE